MNGVRLLFGILGATVMIGTAVAQRPELPAGPNREIVSRECQACHDLSMVVAATGLNRDGWDGVMDEMTSYGMRITAEERAKILDYLANNLGPR
jgi:cytochrome c5